MSTLLFALKSGKLDVELFEFVKFCYFLIRCSRLMILIDTLLIINSGKFMG